MNHKFFTSLISCILLCVIASAQETDSSGQTAPKKTLFNNIFQQVRGAVFVNKKDSAIKASVLNAKSETPFLGYSGKIIRHIHTRRYGFEISFTDTSNAIKYFGTRVLNALHVDTKSWVIRENLFIRENQPLNAYEIADNERYLRTLEFIQDARIVVMPIAGVKDSVDLIVITKDLFSITGGVDVGGLNRVKGRIAETNFLGMGQKIQYSMLLDRKRHPFTGYEFLYSKTSIANSFITLTLAYSMIDGGISEGREDERAEYIRMERPLLSPYAHFAGGLEISRNTSQNVYEKPDSVFLDYRYNIFDIWGGYNLGHNSLLTKNNTNRSRTFFALRQVNKNYTKLPEQFGNLFDPVYNSRRAILGEVTLFKQDFYTTNYIYGFGTTEDVPYGYNIAFTGGWYKQLRLERPYIGINANQFVANSKGEFIQYFFRSGIFLSKGKVQDASILVGGNYYSKLYIRKHVKVREYLKFSLSKIINPVTSEPLRIDNPLGLQYFRSDSVLGFQRLSVYAETFIFTKYKLFGFMMAPFFYADLSLMTPAKVKLFKSDLYSGVGGGLRTRNENLVFGTIELRFNYFPRPADRMSKYSVTFKSNIRFRFNNRYVKAPDFIQLNTDDAIRSY